MTATYPGGLKSFSQRTDAVDDILATDVNQAYDEIEAIEAELGLDPADKTGGTAGAYATVKARMDKAHRAATFVVAASDALADSKQFADYSGDGVADDVQINAAIAAAGAGKVELTEGGFDCVSAIVYPTSVPIRVVGQGLPAPGVAPVTLATVLNFALTGTCVQFANDASAQGLEYVDIEGDGVNTTYAVDLLGSTAFKVLKYVRASSMLTGGFHGTSGNSQNEFHRVYCRDLLTGFAMYGNDNKYYFCQAMRSSGAGIGSSVRGFLTQETAPVYVGCMAERYTLGFEFAAFAKQPSLIGCHAEACKRSFAAGGSSPNEPQGGNLIGFRSTNASDATLAAIDIGRVAGLVIVNPSVSGTTSGKDIESASTSVGVTLVGGDVTGTITWDAAQVMSILGKVSGYTPTPAITGDISAYNETTFKAVLTELARHGLITDSTTT